MAPDLAGAARTLALPVVLTRVPRGVFAAILTEGSCADSVSGGRSLLHATAPMARTMRLAAALRRRTSRRESLKVNVMCYLLCLRFDGCTGRRVAPFLRDGGREKGPPSLRKGATR